MITEIQSLGKYWHECTLHGEGRDHNVYPAHPNGCQLSKDRFLFLYSTRSYRGRDDERSVVYQLRSSGFDGPVITEGFIDQTRDDWNPLRDGKNFVRQTGHLTVFGVPKGAVIGGRRVAHENHFVAMWRVVARWIDPQTGFMSWTDENHDLTLRTRQSHWLQFRLNDAENDIEIIQPAQQMHQIGYEAGSEKFCQQPIKSMIKGYVTAVPMNDECTDWVDLNTVEDGVMPARYRFNEQYRLYEWVQAGHVVGPNLFEAGVARHRNGFVMAARSTKTRAENPTVVWWQTDDPFEAARPALTYPADQPNFHPLTLFSCPDGTLRRMGGCIDRSPHKSGRNPIYTVDIDPDNGFAAGKHQVIFDGCAEELPMSPVYICFPKLMPHCGGDSQYIMFRVRSPKLNHPDRPDESLTQAEMDAAGIYWARIRYDRDYPAHWEFNNMEKVETTF